MESILRTELETADKRIIVLESTIEYYKQIVDAMEQRIELMEENHKRDIKLNYTKNTEL
jgi:ribosomal protein L18